MKTKTIFTLLATLFFTACGCTEDPSDVLPPATQTGANTFGCKINGVVYKTNVKWKWSMVTLTEGVEAYYKDGEMTVRADCVRPNIADVGFRFKYDGGIGKYHDIYFVKENSDSYINVTKFENGIISGTFNITTYLPESIAGVSSLKHYTEGRFDIQTNTNITNQ